MTIAVIEDAFNRVAADLTTSPSGRWTAPAGGGGTNAWLADGQFAKTDPTFGASSRGQLRGTGFDPGVNYGEARARIQRATTGVQEIGIFARSHRVNMATHNRFALVWRSDTTPTRWELRYYTAYSGTPFLIGTAPDSGAGGTGFAMGTAWHDLRLRFVALPNSANVVLSATVDTINLFPGVIFPDYFIQLGGLASFRGFGVEVLSSSAWTAADYAAFDNAELDSLIEANAEPAPVLEADPDPTPITVSNEGAAVDTLPFTPDIGERVTQQWFTVREPTEAGYEVTWAEFQGGRKLFRIGHASLYQSEQATLEAFLDLHAGPTTPFSYATDYGVTIKAHFLSSTFAVTRFGLDQVRVEYVIEELV